MSPRVRRVCLGGLCLAAHLLAAAPGDGAEPLVWKFTKGAKNRYLLTQEMTVKMDLGAGGEATTESKTLTNISWVVTDVRDDGSAVLAQKCDRVRMTMTVAGSPAVEYDTQSPDEPERFAAMIAPMLREMTRSEFKVTMTRRGKITDVETPESLVRALAASPAAPMLGELATPEGLKKIASGVAFELPETLEPGAEWTTETEMVNPMLGNQTIKTTYRYGGPTEVDGAACEEFAPTLEVVFAGSDAVAVQVVEQTSSGQALFNRDAGRLESTNLDHSMTLSLTMGEKQLSQSLEQKVRFEWQPEDAELQ